MNGAKGGIRLGYCSVEKLARIRIGKRLNHSYRVLAAVVGHEVLDSTTAGTSEEKQLPLAGASSDEAKHLFKIGAFQPLLFRHPGTLRYLILPEDFPGTRCFRLCFSIKKYQHV
jgi:hypothetical protein